MFREMRRKNQQIPADECEFILKVATSGVLALEGDDGYPYAVPLSYVYDGEKIYFHCAKEGHKIDAIKRNCKASFCVIERDDVNPEEYTTYYKSVVVFGKIRIIEDEKEKQAAAEKIGRRYAPNGDDKVMESEIKGAWNALTMLEMTIDHVTGKEAKELMKRRNENG